MAQVYSGKHTQSGSQPRIQEFVITSPMAMARSTNEPVKVWETSTFELTFVLLQTNRRRRRRRGKRRKYKFNFHDSRTRANQVEQIFRNILLGSISLRPKGLLVPDSQRFFIYSCFPLYSLLCFKFSSSLRFNVVFAFWTFTLARQ